MTDLTVIVATYNRPDALGACLRALGRQTAKDFEIVVADDGSGPATREAIATWKARFGVPLTHVWQEDRGFRLAEIRNRAIAGSSGGYLVFLDGDCIAPAGFVAAHRALAEPGYFVGGVAFSEVMTFVDTEYQVFALFNQNELHQVEPGNEAEITLDTYPGRIVKAHVDSVIWAQSQGQMDANGNLPQTTFNPPPGQFPVKLIVAEKDHALFLAAGARGAAAIYTEHFALIHIIRKVLIRTSSYLDYIIIKHSIGLH